jgi:heptosyltransferase-2
MNPAKTKVLIVKIGAIGDAVMALSMINEIDKRYPEAEITWLCGDIISPLIKSFSRINKVVTLNENKLLVGSKIEQFSVILKIWTKLFLRRFDLAVNAHRDKRYDLLLLTAIKKEYKSFTGKDRKNQLVQGRYHAVEYARLIHMEDDWKISEPVFPKIQISKAPEIERLIGESKGWKIILTPGGAQNLINGGIQRKWPIENYVLLAEKLIEKYSNAAIILAGSEHDKYAGNSFNKLPVVNLIGKTILTDIINLYNMSNLLITHDTGLLHLAKLSDIYTIALFGPVNPVERIGKNEKIDAIWLGNELPCSPCYNGKSFADCENNVCMKNITVDMVIKKAAKLLESN